MATANTKECILGFVGEKLIGVVFGRLPRNNSEIRSGTKTLIFGNGKGLTIANNGAFWPESEDDIAKVLVDLENEARDALKTIEEARSMAGVLR